MSTKTKTRPVTTPADEATITEANAIPDADLPTDDAIAEQPEPKTPKWPILDKERSAWILEHARPAVAPCLCGCGGTTKGRFVPGHDATLKATLQQNADAGNVTAAEALATFGW